MLKKTRVLFLGLVVLAGSACVTPTHASSAQSVVLTYIQAAGPYGAKDELISLYNNGPLQVDITGWCVRNKSAADFACFTPPEVADGKVTRFMLPGYGSATIASQEYVSAREYNTQTVSLIYEVTSQSSGSLVGSADVVQLVDGAGVSVDTLSWMTAAPSNKYWTRTKLMINPDIYSVSGTFSLDWSTQAFGGLPEDMIHKELVDAPDPEPEPELEPEHPPARTPFVITEVLPNAAGSDAGREYIELHNTDIQHAHILDGLRIRIGIDTENWVMLPSGITVEPGGYYVVSNADLPFTLPNTMGGVQLFIHQEPAGGRIVYESPRDDRAWSLVNGAWVYAVATPGAVNALPVVEIEKVEQQSSAQKPCAINQFRNPETGRCKLIATATSTSTPCKAGQERNPDTNRCRNIAAAKEPTPCKEGQERNPETNRCRNIVKMSTVDYGVKGVQKEAAAQLSWYYIAAIVGVVLLVAGYATWEWRQELQMLAQRIGRAFAKK